MAMLVLMLAPGEGACLRALEPIAAGAYPLKEELASEPCGETKPPVALLYEPSSRFVRAVRAIDEGDVVAAVPPAYLADVRPGQKVTLSAHVGSVAIEREVEAVQPGRAGGRLFVRGADGKAFAVPYPGDVK
jgi:hypothetical protein